MKMRTVILFIAVLALLTGCAAPGQSGSLVSNEQKTLTDMNGRTVTVGAELARVVVLTASDCEIIFALGAGETVVGRGEYCDYPEEAMDISAVQSGSETNLEQIIALEPQVVVMSTMAQSAEDADALSAVGIPVFITDAQSIEGVYEAIRALGGLFGRESEAEDLCGQMRDGFEEIRDKLPDVTEKKKVYFEVSPLEYGLWTAGSGTFMDEIARMLELENIFSDVDGWGKISQEQVIARAPDYIVTVTMYFGEGPSPEEEILSREGWQDIPALGQGNVFHADSDSITRPGPRLVTAARQLYQQVYGL